MSVEQRLMNLIQKYKRMKDDNMFANEYLESALREAYDQLQKDVTSEYKERLEVVNSRLAVMEKENMKIVPKNDGIEEVLRRQELEMRLDLMDDETFKEYAEETLLNDHEYFDELRLFNELKKRDINTARDAITHNRQSRLENNEEYQSLKTESNTLSTFVGFTGEIVYEDDNKKVHFVDIHQVRNETINR